MISRRTLYSLAVLFLFIALPTAYLLIKDIRVLPFLIFASFFCIITAGFQLKLTNESFIYLLLLFYCFLVSSYSLSYSVFGAMIIFYWLAYWPLHMKESAVIFFNQKNILASFVLIGFFCALGIFLQVGLFKFANIEFGKIDLDGGGRQAFGFLWTDYSFLSLFFASLVPLVFTITKSAIWRITLILSFILASILTSARTGIVSLAAAIAIGLMLEIIYSAITGKIKKSFAVLLIFMTIFFPFLIIWLTEKFPRITSLDDSGRLDGFKVALKFVQDNILFGVKFDIQFYKNNVDVIPHNIFIYIVTAGGIFFLTLFSFWGLIVASRIIALRERPIVLSLMVSLIGFQFIPSFFSAYYFAIFIAICLMMSIKNKLLASNKI